MEANIGKAQCERKDRHDKKAVVCGRLKEGIRC